MNKLEQAFHKILYMKILFSVLYAFLGLIIILYSEMTNKVVGICIGTSFMISGLLSIFSFIEKNKIKFFHYNFIFGILSLIMGVFIMLNPLSILNVLNISLGIWLMIESIHKAVYFVNLKKENSKIAKIFLASSALCFFLGIMIIFNPFRSLLITKTIGIFILLYNILTINDLFLLKKRTKTLAKILES